MSKTIEQRPPQVTLAATIVIAASLMVLVSAWERVSNLRTLQTRESVEEFLDGPGRDLGLGYEGVLTILQVSAVLAAVCAVSSAILGGYVLQGDKAARLALTVAVVPLFLTGLLIGGFASSFVAAAAVMLWMEPAREWFATGRWTPPPPREDPATRPSDGPGEGPGDGPGDGPAPWARSSRPETPHEQSTNSTGRAQDPDEPPPHPTPYASRGPATDVLTAPARTAVQPDSQPGVQHPAGRGVADRRPGSVVTAFVLTSVFAALVAFVATLAILVVALVPDYVMDEVVRQTPEGSDPITLQDLRLSTYVSGGLCLATCLAALVFAGFGMRRRPWARRGWLATAAVSAGACLVSVVVAPALASVVLVLVPGGAAVVTIGLLRRPEVQRWFASRPRPS